LISSCIRFWFVIVILKYLNCATIWYRKRKTTRFPL
jgi:hypothetical protein